MWKLMVFIVTAALITGTLINTVAAASSSGTGTASITWEKEPGGGSSGGSGGNGGGGSSGGGNSGGGGSSGGSGSSYSYGRRTYSQDYTATRGPAPATIVSTPSPHMPLGKLPATGGNHLIPFLFLSAGMSFLFAYAASGKGKQPP